MNAPIHTRAEARDLGLAKYWTGKPCAKGHEALRLTASGACIACVAGYRRSYSKAARPRGFIPLTLLTHPDDVDAMKSYVEGLRIARELDA